MRCNGLPESTVGRKEVENRGKCGKFTCLVQDTQCVQATKAISQRGEIVALHHWWVKESVGFVGH